MLESIRQLLIVQDRDIKILSLEKELDTLPKNIEQAHQRMDRDEGAVAAAKQALRETELHIRKLEGDAAVRRETINRLKVQQFETRKNEEYTAFGKEIENYEAKIAAIDDETLAHMVKLDQLKTNLEEAEKKRSATKAMVDEEIAELETRIKNRKEQLSEQLKERAGLAAKADEQALHTYNKLMPRKMPAIVALENETYCGGCRMKLPQAVIATVHDQKTLTLCNYCSRILHCG